MPGDGAHEKILRDRWPLQLARKATWQEEIRSAQRSVSIADVATTVVCSLHYWHNSPEDVALVHTDCRPEIGFEEEQGGHGRTSHSGYVLQCLVSGRERLPEFWQVVEFPVG